MSNPGSTRCIAVAGPLDISRSAHAPAILAAVRLFEQRLRVTHGRSVFLEAFDDDASGPIAAALAAHLALRKVDAVVGHFSSTAAAAAAPFYARRGIPLILPGATAMGLMRYKNTFRVCANDRQYALWIAEQAEKRGWLPLGLITDGGLQGRSLSRQLDAILGERCFAFDRNSPRLPRALLVIGSVKHCWSQLMDHRAALPPDVLFTDDAQSEQFCKAFINAFFDRTAHVLGFSTQCPTDDAHIFCSQAESEYRLNSFAFFLETIAGIETALQLIDNNGHRPLAVSSVLGNLQFDSNREAGLERFLVYRATSNGLAAL